MRAVRPSREQEANMGIPLRVLMVEDSEDDALLLATELKRAGYELTHERVDTALAMKVALDRDAWDLVIGDYSMPHFNGTAALALLRERGFDIPYICVSGTITEELAVAAMKPGANDYVTQGQVTGQVEYYETFVRDVTEQRRLHQQVMQAQKMEAIGRVAGGIAHDFNNLLSVITTCGDLLLDALGRDDPNREEVEQMRKAADSAA